LRFPSLGIGVKQFLTAPIQKDFPSAWMKFPTSGENFPPVKNPCSSRFGTRVIAQKPRCAQKSKNCRKNMSLPLAACAVGDNSPDAYAKELFKPSKDSWILVVCTGKNKLLRFEFGVFGGCSQDWGMFHYFLVFVLW